MLMIISGGQTGLDRAALDVTIELGISHAGYCPKGRRAEDGIVPSKYNLIEHAEVQYAGRTLENVLSSDGTLILHIGIISNGTVLTKQFCIQREKPILIINLLDDLNLSRLNFNRWMKENFIKILNVAGPRESEAEIYNISKNVLLHLLCDIHSISVSR